MGTTFSILYTPTNVGVSSDYAVIEVQRIVGLPTSNHFLGGMEQIQRQNKRAFSTADQLVTRYLYTLKIFYSCIAFLQHISYSYTGEQSVVILK